MTEDVRAVVQRGPRRLELDRFPRPSIEANDGILRVEACGLCGSDREQFTGELVDSLGWKYPLLRYPVIPGHEVVGTVEDIGGDLARRWGVAPGDRIALRSSIPCGSCRRCDAGQTEACEGPRRAYGMTTVDQAPGLWGGLAECLYLDPNAELYRLPPDVPPDVATLYNPLAAGVQWTHTLGSVRPGDRVVVFGPGQRGLACVFAARRADAAMIIAVGTRADGRRLEVARSLGADHAIAVEETDVTAAVRDLTDGRGADVVIDASALATEPVVSSLDVAAMGATVVYAGLKAGRATAGFVSDTIVSKRLTIRGASGPTGPAIELAIRWLEEHGDVLSALHTHTFGLDDVTTAQQALARNGTGHDDPIHIAVCP